MLPVKINCSYEFRYWGVVFNSQHQERPKDIFSSHTQLPRRAVYDVVWSLSDAGIVGLNTAEGMDVLLC